MKRIAPFTIALALLSSTQAFAERTYLAFPRGFKWCVATAAHQVEGFNTESDWWDWEHLPGKIKHGDKSGAACNHWNMLERDTEIMKELNIQQYRFSIEWAKIEPREGEWDWSAVEHYRKEIALMREAGIEPMITVHHFVLPRWFANKFSPDKPDKKGWEWEGSAAAFGRYADFIYRNIGVGVRDWITTNEPMIHLAGAYFAGVTPPGKNNLIEALEGPLPGLLRAHAAGYHALHKAAKEMGDLPIRVGVAHHMRVFDPDSIFNPLDALAARILDQANNWLFGDAIESGRLRINIPWIIDLDLKIEGLEGTQDFIGVNYYTRDMVSLSLSGTMGLERLVNEQSPTTDMGWEIYPEGFYRTLKSVAQRYPGKPVIITENGIADSRDQYRKQFLEDHLAVLHRALMEGIPIEGYCHWSLMDNFEWIEGYEPRFGLYDVDYKTFKRTARPSAVMYSKIAAENGFWAEPYHPGRWQIPFTGPSDELLRRQRYSPSSTGCGISLERRTSECGWFRSNMNSRSSREDPSFLYQK